VTVTVLRKLPRTETCREWLDEANNRCGERAVAILWGKLFPPEALGPRCEAHATAHCGERSLEEIFHPDRPWAVYDLRQVNALHG